MSLDSAAIAALRSSFPVKFIVDFLRLCRAQGAHTIQTLLTDSVVLRKKLDTDIAPPCLINGDTGRAATSKGSRTIALGCVNDSISG